MAVFKERENFMKRLKFLFSDRKSCSGCHPILRGGAILARFVFGRGRLEALPEIWTIKHFNCNCYDLTKPHHITHDPMRTKL